jgi:dienelactone hydrolase
VDATRIGLLGLSMGGEQAITAAASDERIAAVVAEGVSARVPEDLAYLPEDAFGAIQRIEASIMWAVADAMTEASPPIPLREAAARASLRAPLLLIVGSDPNDAAAAIGLQASAPVLEVWRVADTPHIQALALHPEEWERRVLAFLDTALAA